MRRERHAGIDEAGAVLAVLVILVLLPAYVEADLFFRSLGQTYIVEAVQSEAQAAAAMRSAPQVAGGRGGDIKRQAPARAEAAYARAAIWSESRWRLDPWKGQPSGESCGPAGRWGARCIVHWPSGETRIRCPTFEPWSDCREYEAATATGG